MAYPFSITDDDGFINDYNTVPDHPDIVYINIVTERCRHCSVITKTLVDIRFVNELANFMWYGLKTNHSTYYIGKPRNDFAKEVLARFNRKNIEMHTLVALLADIPNPNNYKYVGSFAWSDNRVENLYWSPNKAYKLKYGEDLEYPDDVKEKSNKITWHVTNETGLDGTVVHKTFFKFGHPYLGDKSWSSSKSSKFTNQEKFDTAIKKYHEFTEKLVNEFPLVSKIENERETINELIYEYDESH